jgi:hypothetical protein
MIPKTTTLDNDVLSSQDLSSSVPARARAPGLYKDLSSPDQRPPPPPSAGDAVANGAELLYRVTRHLVRNSPLKQKLDLLLDLLGLVDDFPEQ